MNGNLLSIKGLSTWYELKKWGFFHAGYVRALEDVSFDLRQGEALTVVGESGSGKTTLLKTILGLVPPTKGEIFFDGGKIAKRSDIVALRRKAGYVQQDPYGALPPFMNVRRILLEPMVVNRVGTATNREARIREVLDQVRLTPPDEFLYKFPHMLSGGQQQRVVIARALVLQPKMIVADEPVSMLDASVRVEILQLMRRIQKDLDLAVIYVTHDLSTVRYFSERVFIMYAGKLVEEADVRTIVYNPLHPYTQALLEAIPDPNPENVKRMRNVPPGEPPSLVRPPSGCRFHPRCTRRIEGLCETQVPPPFSPEPNHRVECWLYRP
ncbi:MAG: ABC transporter ATP-binding protein [Candidatus Bipolaricaulaceae bacterium]